MLLILAVIDLVLSLFQITFIDYRFLMLMYIGIVGPIYIIYNVRLMVVSKSLHKGYQRLINPDRKMVFPEDDFLG